MGIRSEIMVLETIFIAKYVTGDEKLGRENFAPNYWINKSNLRYEVIFYNLRTYPKKLKIFLFVIKNNDIEETIKRPYYFLRFSTRG